MKKTILILSLFVSLNLFSQANMQSPSTQISDSMKVAVMTNELNDYFLGMSSWTPEEKEYFVSNFVYTRGNFTIPKRPTESPKKND